MTERGQERTQGISFVDKAEQTYFAQAQLGDDIYAFLKSPTGRYLHGCAKQEVEALRDAMEGFDPTTFWGRWRAQRKLRKLQIRAKAARYFMTWMAEAIQQGEHAFKQLEEYRSE